jgi:acetate CoA/acetoacetate CoA-transferase alpha subunit
MAEQLQNRFGKIRTVEQAMEHVNDGITLMLAGFCGVGCSYRLCREIEKKGVKDLTLISIDAGDPGVGPEDIIKAELVKKLIASHIGATPRTGELFNEGKLEVEFSPQGILAERIRAGGAGIPGFLTDVGLGTMVEEGKPKVTLNGKEYILETALRADVAIIQAKKADEFGNLVYDKTARGVNPLMARAADLVIVDAKEIVPLGAIDPEEVVTPGAFVDIIVRGGGEWTWAWE